MLVRFRCRNTKLARKKDTEEKQFIRITETEYKNET